MRCLRLAPLAGLLALLPTVAAQAPGARASQGEPLPTASAPAAVGGELERLGAWAEGPSYAVDADAEGRIAWGAGRIVRATGPGGSETAVELPGLVRDLALAWPLAYVATQHFGDGAAQGLEIVDLEAGAVVGRVPDLFALGVHVEGTVAYVAAFDGGWRLVTVDVSVPTAPVRLGQSESLSGYFRGVDVQDGIAYVGAGAVGVHVLDVGVPASPAFVRTVAVPGYARYLDVSPDGLAVAFGDYNTVTGGVAFYELSTPDDPQLTAAWTVSQVVEDAAWVSSTQVAAAGAQGGVYLAATSGAEIERVITETANLVAGANRVVVEPGGTVLSADYYYGGFRVDFASASFEPVWTGASFTSGLLADADDASTVYAAAGAYGVARLEAGDDGLVQTGRAHDFRWNYTRDIAQDADRLYVADGFSGLQVVDKATMGTLGGRADFFLDRVAFDPATGTIVASGQGNVLLATWDETAGVQIRTVLADLDVQDLEAADGVAYLGLADQADALVLRLSDDTIVDTIDLGDAAPGVALALDRDAAQLAVQGDGVQGRLYDLAVPEAPELIGSTGTTETVGLALENGLYAATGQTSVFVTDVTDPTAPTGLGSRTDLLASPDAVALSSAGLFVAVDNGGVDWLRDGRVVAAEGEPRDRTGLAAWPNPSAGTVRIAADLAAPARLDVWTVTGRRVRSLDVLPTDADTVWDGRDASGQPVAAGVYLLRLVANGDVETVRVTITR